MRLHFSHFFRLFNSPARISSFCLFSFLWSESFVLSICRCRIMWFSRVLLFAWRKREKKKVSMNFVTDSRYAMELYWNCLCKHALRVFNFLFVINLFYVYHFQCRSAVLALQRPLFHLQQAMDRHRSSLINRPFRWEIDRMFSCRLVLVMQQLMVTTQSTRIITRRVRFYTIYRTRKLSGQSLWDQRSLRFIKKWF